MMNPSFPSAFHVGHLPQRTERPTSPWNTKCSTSPITNLKMLLYPFISNFSNLRFVDFLYITVPVSGSSPPVVSKCDGHHEWDGRNRILTWSITLIDASSKNGAFEFAVAQADPKGFFPLAVNFSSSKTFCDITISNVTNGDAPVKHTESTALTVEEFKIV